MKQLNLGTQSAEPFQSSRAKSKSLLLSGMILLFAILIEAIWSDIHSANAKAIESLRAHLPSNNDLSKARHFIL